MSQRTLEIGAARLTQGRRDTLYRTVAATASLVLMAALAYDMLSGRWIGAAGWHLAASLTAVLLLMPAARRIRYLHVGVVYVFGLFVYTVLRSFADSTFVPVRSDYVIRLDRVLFFGAHPTQWLQATFFDPGRLRLLDWLTVQVHWSYFALPHVAALAVYLRRRELFPTYVAVVLGTFYAGLMLYFLLPTTPPWLAADQGLLPGVHRVMDFVGGQVDTDSYHRLYDAIGVPNAVAAMPSLHMGVTFAIFLFARGLNRWLGRVMLIYALLMGFSLVYMGEHYVTDVLAGAAIASAVYLAVRRAMPPAPVPVRVRR